MHSRRRILLHLLNSLDLQDTVARTTASHALLYLLQGSFGETSSEREQLAWIQENARMVFELGGIEDLFVACRRACWRHDWVSTLPDFVPQNHSSSSSENIMTPQEKIDYLESINVEVSVHFSQLYTVIESLRGDFRLSEALMIMDPPLPNFFLNLVANLREKSIKGFPVKKLVLLTWKSLLASMGGSDALSKCKERVRIREGLVPKSSLAEKMPVIPQDIRQFQSELMAKYPTLVDHQRSELIGGTVLANATLPLSTNHNTHGPTDDALLVMDEERIAMAKSAAAPPPLKPGRQKFQTNQSRPFILPFAPVKNGPDVPVGIQEASSLYRDRLFIGTGTWQTWCVRQEFLNEARGAQDSSISEVQEMLQNLCLRQPGPVPISAEDDQRLEWIDEIYRRSLPSLQSAVIVLLKLVLATATTGSTSSAYVRAVAEGTPSEQAPSPTLEDVDICRHREILNKAVSSFLLLCLHWFKASHILKFEYLAQVLLDTNVILLILKLFGLQVVDQAVHSRCEAHPFGLFEYCRLVGHDHSTSTPQQILEQLSLLIGNVWNEYPNDPLRIRHSDSQTSSPPFSWRNMATASNFTRILYQVCKSKIHRILLLVQYKSSAILKRTLSVPHSGLELYVLKLLKCQIPYCGRKWRQSNMRIITQIYLRCRPRLREDWPGGSDLEAEVEASLPEEQTLRTLIQFFNKSRYRYLSHVAGTEALPANAKDAYAQEWNEASRDIFEREAFPPHPHSVGAGTPGRYISGVSVEGYFDAYEDVMEEMYPNDTLSILPGVELESPSTNNTVSSNGQNVWEHMSPHEMDVLSRSPNAARKSLSPRNMSSRSPSTNFSVRRFSASSSPGVRQSLRRVHSNPGIIHPTLHWNAEDLVEDAISTEEETNETPAPSVEEMMIPDAPLSSPHPGGIDEVEHIFGA